MLLLIADTPEMFVAQIIRLLSDTALRQRLAEEAVAVVRQTYSWDTIGHSLVAAYEEAFELKARFSSTS